MLCNKLFTQTTTKIGYIPLSEYIIVIKLLKKSITNEFRDNIIDPLHAYYRTNLAKVIDIFSRTNENKHLNFTVSNSNGIKYIVGMRLYEPNIANGFYYVIDRMTTLRWFYPNNVPSTYTGICETYYENGRKELEFNVINGVINGKFTRWNKYGELVCENNYVDGNQTGIQVEWSDGNGTSRIKKEYNMISNRKYGKEITWSYPIEKGISGKIQSILNYEHDRLSGLCVEYYPNGKRKHEYTYGGYKLNKGVDVLHGTNIEYYSTGVIKSKYKYDNGKKVGDFVEYYSNGQIRIQQKTTMYNENGKILLSIEEMIDVVVRARLNFFMYIAPNTDILCDTFELILNYI